MTFLSLRLLTLLHGMLIIGFVGTFSLISVLGGEEEEEEG